MKIGPILANSAVFFISCVIGLLLCEVGARFALTASDYLSVEMVPDEVLGAVPSTHTRAGDSTPGASGTGTYPIARISSRLATPIPMATWLEWKMLGRRYSNA